MLKQNLQPDYTQFRRTRQLVLPLETEPFIAPNESVRLLDQVMDELDYRDLYRTYPQKGRKPETDPVIMAKIVVYAYSQRTFSTREIEKSCRYDLRYHYLLQRQKAPDHNTICRFIRDHLSGCLEDLLNQLIRQLAEAGEISFEQIFLDGTKVEANANRYTFIWRGTVEKNQEKHRQKALKYLKEELKIETDTAGTKELRKAFRQLQNRAEKEQIVFVHGIGKHKTELQRQYETVEEMLRRSEFYEEALQTMGKDRNSYSRTDPDATFMHMKDDHMRNSQLKPGYNVQVASTSEYMVGVMVNSDRTDFYSLIPMVQKPGTSFPEKKIGKLAADAGYESEEGYHFLEEQDIQAYIKPSNYEYSKTRKYQRDMEFRQAMEYDPKDDSYTCKGGRKLNYSGTRRTANRNGYVSESRIYQCKSCEGCPYCGKCYKGKHAKQISVASRFDEYRARSRTNIESEEGILLRINRSIQAEGVFGILKQDMGHTRFLRRGMDGVRTEYLLLAFGFNLNKLHHRIQEGRLGKHLLIPESLQETA